MLAVLPRCFITALALSLAMQAAPLLGQSNIETEASGNDGAGASLEVDCKQDADDESMSEDELAAFREQCGKGRSLSNYVRDVPATSESGKSVEADLIDSDTVKPAIFPIDVVHDRFDGIYRLKERINDTFGLAFSVDYTLLAQRATYTEGETNTGSSSVFRILGTWLRLGDPKGLYGTLVWKTETRNPIWGNITPRDFGFATGSALSTANFKSLDWCITDLYWKQLFNGRRLALLVGHMDPGDWADQYPLLNAWTSLMNDAFYNNPTEAIPKRGFGMAGQAFLADTLYLAGGVHDANGGDGDLDFDSFWNTRELFSWVELGHRSGTQVSVRRNVHLHYWHQDRREEAGTGESRGLAAT
jgi:hypothetical protein